MTLFIAMSVATSYASPGREIIAEGTYQAGDSDTPLTGQAMALLLAKRNALEQSGTYISSTTTMQNYIVNNDNVTSLAAGVMEVTILENKKTPNGGSTEYFTKIKAIVHPDRFEQTLKLMDNGITLNSTRQIKRSKITTPNQLGNQTLNNILLQATLSNDLVGVQDAIEHGANANYGNGSLAGTVLIDAIKGRNIEMVKYLLAKDADPNMISEKFTPLAAALNTQNYEIVKAIIDAGVDVNVRLEDGRTAIFFLAGSVFPANNPNNLTFFKLLVANGAKLDIADERGNTLLIRMVQAKNTEIVKIMLDARVNPNTRDIAGKTALDYAVGSSELVNLLLPVTNLK